MSRRGMVKKRCSSCGRRVSEKRCPSCGSIRYSWAYVVDIGAVGGKRKQHTKSGFKTKAEAVAALATIQSSVARGDYVEPSSQSLGLYLQFWLRAQQAQLRASTLQSYESAVELHIAPRIGDVRLQAVTASTLDVLYADLLQDGRRDGRGGLSPHTVRNIHAVLRKALSDAARKGSILRNPAEAADPPKLGRSQVAMETWTPEQLRSFLNHTIGDRLYAAWVVAATTGMRRGEVLGLRWQDIDLEGMRLSVRQTLLSVEYDLVFSTPKTRKGTRSIALDTTTVSALRAHKARQAEERLAWGPGWGDSGLAFTRENGSPIHPDLFSKRFGHQVKAAALPDIRLHDLRHTHATLALQAGIHPKVVSERLGHANVAITLDTYTHVVPALQSDAAELVAGLVFGPDRTHP